jgi:GTP diphosphokinase / guanosine-3',5'-bis(diphosphate) 3'-diphosphatase
MTGLTPEHIHNEIWNAYIYARDAHEGQMRKSGDPYIIHPVEATVILMSLEPDIHTIQACLLHDVIEDTPKTKHDIFNAFWDEVAFLCEWLEKLSNVRYQWKEREIGSLRKMFIAMADDLRVIFIKLSDRLHNMQTLKYHPKPEKREKIALETLNIFSPIADRLWLYNLKNSLDEECFKILEPKDYRNILKQLKALEVSRDAFLANAKVEIIKVIGWDIKNCEIDYRVKSIYSIYKKLNKKWLTDISHLYDIFGIRIIVHDLSECYRTLWLIHQKWSPLPYRFKDYIALPKPNWYKSIHTTIVWLLKEHRKQPTEIQIKTFEMKHFSDIWVAAHFEYKERGSVISKDIDWVGELKEIAQNLEDSDMMWSLKIDIFKHRIFVFTPQWDLINLPHGSTPVDFAYYLHTDLWDHLAIAKVNEKIFPLDKELHNWDRVELIIDKNKRPNPFWISFVKTTKAKNAIKAFMKKEDKEIHRERGKEILNKYLTKLWLNVLDKEFSLLRSLDWRIYTLEERWQLLEQIGNLSMNPNVLIRRIIRTNKIKIPEIQDEKTEEKIEIEISDKSTQVNDIIEDSLKMNIIIWWEEGIKYKRCYCCRRKIPADIVAHINVKSDITVHRRDCKILKWVNKDRLLSAYVQWNEQQELGFFVNVVFKNETGILKILTEIIFSMEIDIDEINSKKQSNKFMSFDLRLNVPNHDYLVIDRFIERVQFAFEDDLINYRIEEI